MRIFLTGGTGYIGSAVLDGLVRAGHQVTALVRNSEKAATVSERGADPLVGSLDAPDSYSSAAGHEAYIHTAEDDSRREELDRVTVDALIGLATPSPESLLLYTSGTWVLGNTREAAGEDAPLNPTPHVAWRPAHEQRVLKASGNGLRTVVVRPGIVYGGSRGIIGDMLKDARNGLMRVIGTGENHWPLVYDRDLGDLYVRIVARQDASGIYHANDEGDERVNEIVEAIAVHPALTPDVRHVPIAEARKKLGDLADALALDQIVRSPRARELGWTPTLKGVARNAARLLEEWRVADG